MIRAALAILLVLLAGCSRQPVDCADVRGPVVVKPQAPQPRAEPGSALNRLRLPWREPAGAVAPAPAKPPPIALPVAKPEPKAKPKKAERRAEPEPRPKKQKKRKQREAREAARPEKPRQLAAEAGPDLPWSCWQVRFVASGRTRAELEAMGRQRGINLTKKQIKQAQACLGR